MRSAYQDQLTAMKNERDRAMRELWERYQARIREMRTKHKAAGKVPA